MGGGGGESRSLNILEFLKAKEREGGGGNCNVHATCDRVDIFGITQFPKELGWVPTKKTLQGVVSIIKYFLGQSTYVELLNCLLLKRHENHLKILLDPIGFEEISYKT